MNANLPDKLTISQTKATATRTKKAQNIYRVNTPFTHFKIRDVGVEVPETWDFIITIKPKQEGILS